ncbi:hypothetical protein EIB18_07460 [Caulobacter vibrioides]|uniref:Uncharacterized protein n=2 Tax=Caulobacter vibrioides TaxID=155892 RepID=Q9A8G3_CAUVC|nr:hypothetical protein [Caulobacter vibrioides]YP_002516830.1 hypothetical protein CCNA_01457 [Caulobacter vibrioides NA1000]AAK23372.1 hypothetical protein CC_1391 [Caulobacter vibrioides CB15]ACL94922.1 hypothetical protein CCNA_01457 [Caulobacter vibrioides NA1000]ATC24413.1 hypothetical protein CA608_07730 [Caulobacter vibrioides]ATC28202.1 hypothetical protein CA607_07370 [Caulobacter vibrioides]AZH12565.1 hypothetical protein EIB18_07460 [Caulobacter vibrioides]
MLPRPQRNTRLIGQARGLHSLADRLQPDRNAARFLVHETLMAALGLPDDQRGTKEQGRDLRRWMIAHLRTSRRAIPSVAPVGR